MYDNTLPLTGVGLTIAGHQVSLSTLLIGVVVLVVLGVALIRIGSRAKRRDRV